MPRRTLISEPAAPLRSAAAIYCRISSDPTGFGLGVQRQEFECRELAERLELDVGAVFVDNDISAYRNAHRPAWSDLRDRILIGEFQALIAWHPDRLTRHPIQLEALVELLDATRTHVYTVSAGEYDLGNATGRMCARVVGAVARHESEHKSERQSAQARQAALSGKSRSRGHRAFGFEKNGIDHRPDEAKAVRWAAKQFLAGRSLTYIAKRMPPTVTGSAPWTTTMLKRVLVAPRITGLRAYRGVVVAEGQWKPILDRETWKTLCVQLVDNRRRRVPRTKYLLTNIITDYKGEPGRGRTNEYGLRAYSTSATADGQGCSVKANEVDAMVLSAIRLQQKVRREDRQEIPEWESLTWQQRRILVRDTFESIVIHPAVFDTSHRANPTAERTVITMRQPGCLPPKT